ncbi:uncharacterized protein BYT42DRAFT_565073 [Radiomyces spectabilis]|uniref:uncharacterized protein n=1 Tax=Radiomyces spectabilis TaxID=64574 RepID=UPI00222051F5|nr:uncharacterized protein BYT42DRAFT_565073 [Radiomyces spectabilis]KAI8381051.1 hypothetical protein BYT42DRAFT_565073 [Radiomyces spectabilis]
MTSGNPFDDNPWSNNGPRFGNAYENDSNKYDYSPSPMPQQRMPSPSDYQTPAANRPWAESNKTEYAEHHSAWNNTPPPSQPANAYQYTGTRFGNSNDFGGNAYSATPVSPSPAPTPASTTAKPSNSEVEAALPPVWKDKSGHPSKLRLLLRFLQFIASVGHLGFAAGALPYSKIDSIPFDSSACFYFLYAVACMSIIWSVFQMSLFLHRRLFHGNKMNRVIMSGIDLFLTLMWGIGIIVEIAKFTCKPGGYDGFCNFYNVSIFWGFLAFVLYIIAIGWDIIGSCMNRRR